MSRIKECEVLLKERQLKTQSVEKISRTITNDDNENENRRLKLQVKQLIDETGFLRSDLEIVRKKYNQLIIRYEKLTRESKSSRSDIKLFNEENEKLRNEVSNK